MPSALEGGEELISPKYLTVGNTSGLSELSFQASVIEAERLFNKVVDLLCSKIYIFF